MKLFAHSDVSGTIRSITWFNAPEGVSLMLTPRPGELVTEIQGHKLTDSVPSDKALRNLAENYTVAAPLTRSTLKKKA